MNSIRRKNPGSFQERLFWRIYTIERRITKIACQRYQLPSINRITSFVVMLSVLAASLPHTVVAQVERVASINDFATLNPVVSDILPIPKEVEKEIVITSLPQAQDKQPAYSKYVTVTFYSSTPDQTDDTPFITANGTYVYDGIAATNALPFGTHIKLPELFGDKSFTVQDRMNKRYWDRVDVWVETREEAKELGKRYTLLEIY